MNYRDVYLRLLEHLEEELEAMGILCLYLFSWGLNYPENPLDPEERQRLMEEMYQDLRQRHCLRLVWVTWPDVTIEDSTPATDDTPLDFWLDQDGPGKPLLALAMAADEGTAR